MRLIESPAMRLEPLVAAHAEEMFETLSSPAIYDYMPGAPPPSVAALRKRYERLEMRRSGDGTQLWLNWIVRILSGRCVGFVQATIHPGTTADFAFAFAPEYWGRGIAFEACRMALGELAGQFGVGTFFATVDPRNRRSTRLLERLGFSNVPPENYPNGDVVPDDRLFALIDTTASRPEGL